MILLKRTGLYLLIIIFVVVSVGYLLPRKVTVHSHRGIPVPAKLIFTQISDLHCWKGWMPWLQTDTALQISINPLPNASSEIVWNSPMHKHDRGFASILGIYPDSLVRLKMELKEYKAIQAQYQIKEFADSVNVIWDMEFDLGNNPFKRYPGLFLNSLLKKDMEKGLFLLDSIAQLTPRNE